MSASPVREFLSFRRTFMLLVLMVVVPSAGLSGFGILAIVNERAAVEKRLELAWQGRLQDVSERLTETLSSVSMQPTAEGLRVQGPDGSQLAQETFLLRDGRIEVRDPAVGMMLEGLTADLNLLPSRRAVFSIASPEVTLVVATLREGAVVHGAILSFGALSAMAEAMAGAEGDTDGAEFLVRPIPRPGGESLMQRLVSEVAQARQVVTGPEQPLPLAERALAPPLQDVMVLAIATEEDPVALTATRNRTVYGILLGLFYVTLVVGVVLTGRTLYREVQLSRLKTDFVSQVSHELRTPLTSIRMFIETLAQGRVTDPEQTRVVLGLLLQETERLSAMIERVLDWGRIESGRRTYAQDRLSPSELTQIAEAAFRAQRMDAAYELEVDVEENLPEITGDREALSAALLNLLQNAYKYSSETKQIRMSARGEGRRVAFDVVDNGVGIANRERRLIFDRFYRVESLLTRRNEGSGLGLSIARRIVEAHGGTVSLESRPGHGSTFTIHLPIAQRRKGRDRVREDA